MQTDLERLSGIINQRGVTSSLVLKSEIYRALSEIALQSGGLLDTAIYSADVSRAIEYVSSHLSARLTVSEIADAVNLATSTLSGKFRREVGMSVGEYIDYRVILAAAQMLFSDDRSILEISEELGFCDQFYFSRRFKERYGVSPQKFRKM
jgi:AraC-like DNA-binding protein